MIKRIFGTIALFLVFTSLLLVLYSTSGDEITISSFRSLLNYIENTSTFFVVDFNLSSYVNVISESWGVFDGVREFLNGLVYFFGLLAWFAQLIFNALIYLFTFWVPLVFPLG